MDNPALRLSRSGWPGPDSLGARTRPHRPCAQPAFGRAFTKFGASCPEDDIESPGARPSADSYFYGGFSHVIWLCRLTCRHNRRRLRGPVAHGLANAVTVLLALVIAVDVFAVHAGLNIHALLGNLLSTTRHELAQGDDLYGLPGTLQLVCTLATAAVFIVWFHRVRVNAEGFARDVCTMHRAWAVGAWFVPIGNLWLPYRFAKEVWDASAQSTAGGAWREVSHRRVTAWWTTWIAALAVDRVGASSTRTRRPAGAPAGHERRDAVRSARYRGGCARDPFRAEAVPHAAGEPRELRRGCRCGRRHSPHPVRVASVRAVSSSSRRGTRAPRSPSPLDTPSRNAQRRRPPRPVGASATAGV